MAKCANTQHKWMLMTINGKSVWVYCHTCGEKFPFTGEQNGARFSGKLPDRYLVDNA